MEVPNKILRVLFIEDSEDDFELVSLELIQAGFELKRNRVETVPALLNAFKNQVWDIVICDHNLPALDSTTALRIVKEFSEELPFIIVSGLIPDELAIESMRQGAKDFIRKNNLSRLAPVVERELREYSLKQEFKQLSDNLYRVTHFDHLTGLGNREHLFKNLTRRMSGGQGENPFCIFLIDLNRFKKITRSLGLLAGNSVLVEVAQRLRTTFGEDYYVARYWGDKFVVVASNVNCEAHAEEVVNTIHNCLEQAFQIDGNDLFVSARLGVSFYPKDGDRPEFLMEKVEAALCSAKDTTGRSFQFYEVNANDCDKQRLDMESDLHKALRNNEFILQYQPQFDLATNQIIGAEALVRWRSPQLGLVSPATFIPVLEDTGLIVEVGEWILRTACAQNKKWQNEGLPPICMAVNLSAIQFKQPNLIPVVECALHYTGLSPQYLELEITENVALNSENIVLSTLDQLRDIGIKLSIDDFGTGYSSLSYLKRYSIDKLKIDQSFIRGGKNGTPDYEIVRAIIAMGHSLKLKVIAEGVETTAQAEFLKHNGCDEVQGYLYGKPMDPEAFAMLMIKTGNTTSCAA